MNTALPTNDGTNLVTEDERLWHALTHPADDDPRTEGLNDFVSIASSEFDDQVNRVFGIMAGHLVEEDLLRDGVGQPLVSAGVSLASWDRCDAMFDVMCFLTDHGFYVAHSHELDAFTDHKAATGIEQAVATARATDRILRSLVTDANQVQDALSGADATAKKADRSGSGTGVRRHGSAPR